jgi:hypothetical protein
MIGYYSSYILGETLQAASNIEAVGGTVINFDCTATGHYVYFRVPSKKVREDIEHHIGYFHLERGIAEEYRKV